MAAIVLSGNSYNENFDGIGSGLPNGVTVRTGATASVLGTASTFTATATSWTDTVGRFKNFASVTGLVSTATSATQAAATDRALGIRQSSAFGDPGAAFVFEIQDTISLQGISLSFQSEMASVQARSTTWVVDYGIGTSPTSFTSLSPPISDPGLFGETTQGFMLPTAVENLSTTLWLRVAALSGSTGSGSRDSFGIDDFRLTYSRIPEPASIIVWAAIFGIGIPCVGVTKVIRR
jgi:hypothetical protein